MSKNIFDIFNESDIESITNLITKLEDSTFDYLKLESEDVKIVIGKNGVLEGEVSQAPIKSANVNGASAAQPQLEDETAKATIDVEQEVAISTNQEESIHEQDDLVVIEAPTYGLYYAQPAPGQPQYVKVGDTVKTGDTVGLLEIMKVFNAITSDIEGEIVQIHVQNMDLVEPGQPLISVKVKSPNFTEQKSA